MLPQEMVKVDHVLRLFFAMPEKEKCGVLLIASLAPREKIQRGRSLFTWRRRSCFPPPTSPATLLPRSRRIYEGK